MCGPCGLSEMCKDCTNNPNKEEFMFEEEAEKYVAEKADKGNFDVEKFGKAYFSESAMRLAFKAGADFGFKECAKSRLNITTISDRPAEGIIEELQEQIEKMKCCFNCSKWNDGECEESPKDKTFFCADFKCESWECIK